MAAENVEKPKVVEDNHVEFLNALRLSGETNMFGAGAFLQEEFGLTARDARTVLLYWMQTFAED